MILKEVTQPNDWRLSELIKMYKDNKGYVQTVQLYLGCSDPTKFDKSRVSLSDR